MTALDQPSLADQIGASKKPSPFAAVGAPGTAIFGGYIVETEKDPRLTGREKYRTYSNMLANTSIVAAGVRFFLNLLSKATWKVEPADDSEEAAKIAELIDEIKDSMTTPWHRIVRRAAMYRFYGFSIQEWTAVRRDDGSIGFLDIEPRPQLTIEQWDRDDSGTIRGVVQRNPQTQQALFLPRGKIVYLVDDSLNDSPEGLGLFRHLVSRALRIERYEQLEGWGFERDLRGTPIGRGPLAEMEKMVQAGTLTRDQVNELREPVEQFVRNALKGRDTGIILDSATYRATGENQQPSTTPQWNVELLQGSSTSQEAVAAAIERVNREAARILGVEHLLLGSDSAGSFALSRDKTQSFGLIVSSTLQEMKESFEADIIAPLMELNGWDEKLTPTFNVEQVQYRDPEQITTAIKDLAQAGAAVLPNDPVVNAIRELLGLPAQPEEVAELMIPMPLSEQQRGQLEPPGEGEGEGTPSEEGEVPKKEEKETEKRLAKVLVKPKRGEKRDAFVARFMSNETAQLEFPDQEQRLAVAFEQFRSKRSRKVAKV